MGGKVWSAEEDEFIRASIDKLTSAEIANALGRTKLAIDSRRKTLGLSGLASKAFGSRRSESWLKALEARIGEPIESWLCRRYIEQRASYREITAELGINTRPLMKLMRRAGIEPISRSEAVARQMERNPDFLANMIVASHTPESRHKRALHRQVNWQTFCTPQEHHFLEALREQGLDPIPQLAVGSYNIDFAFPELLLGVECDPRWHTTKSRLERDARRDAQLVAMGWEILRLDTRTSTEFNVSKVSDALKRRASTHPR